MYLYMHHSADSDLDDLYEKCEEEAATIEEYLTLLTETPKLVTSLIDVKAVRMYNPIGIDSKKIVSLWNRGLNVLRIRFIDDPLVDKYRIIYAAQFDALEENEAVHILAIVEKSKKSGFNYQASHPIMERVENDYESVKR